MFDDAFVDSLPDDPLESFHSLCIEFSEFDDSINREDQASHYNSYLTAFGLVQALMETYEIGISNIPEIGDDLSQNILKIRRFFSDLQKDVFLDNVLVL